MALAPILGHIFNTNIHLQGAIVGMRSQYDSLRAGIQEILSHTRMQQGALVASTGDVAAPNKRKRARSMDVSKVASKRQHTAATDGDQPDPRKIIFLSDLKDLNGKSDFIVCYGLILF